MPKWLLAKVGHDRRNMGLLPRWGHPKPSWQTDCASVGSSPTFLGGHLLLSPAWRGPTLHSKCTDMAEIFFWAVLYPCASARHWRPRPITRKWGARRAKFARLPENGCTFTHHSFSTSSNLAHGPCRMTSLHRYTERLGWPSENLFVKMEPRHSITVLDVKCFGCDQLKDLI